MPGRRTAVCGHSNYASIRSKASESKGEAMIAAIATITYSRRWECHHDWLAPPFLLHVIYLLCRWIPILAHTYTHTRTLHKLYTCIVVMASDIRQPTMDAKRFHDKKAKWAYGDRCARHYLSSRPRPAMPDTHYTRYVLYVLSR